MELKINIVSKDEEFALKQSQNLKNWIEDDEDLENITVKQDRKSLENDDAGGGLLSILQVMVGAALEPFAKTLQVWMQEKTKRSVSEFSVELESPDGKKFKVNSNNIGEDDRAFVTEIIERFEGNTKFNYEITESSKD